MTTAPTCVDCGVEMDTDSPGELCPECQFHRQYRTPVSTEAIPEPPAFTRPSTGYVRPLGDYEILEKIALGGMGVVYKARQVSLNRLVALKMTSPEFLERFRREAQAAAKLDHPNIVPIHEFGCQEDQHFFSMRLIEGCTLADAISTQQYPARHAVQLIVTIARALHHAHQHGVLHRDLKPSNILLDPQGRPHLIDFGLAKLLDSGEQARAEGAMGTPSYMAPEQAAGNSRELTTAADVYSVGVILYELLTGRTPFRAATPLETMRRAMEEPPRPVRQLSHWIDRDLEAVCLKCLEKSPQRRYGSAEALADDLERWLRHEPVTARRNPSWERSVKWVRRRPAIAVLLGTLCLVIVLAFLGIFSQWQQTIKALELAEQRKHSTQVALDRAERNLYFNRIALASSEWLANNVERADHLLQECPPPLRNWEWFYLNRLCHSELVTIPAGVEVSTVAFSPDGQSLAFPGLLGSGVSNTRGVGVLVCDARTSQQTLALDSPRGWPSQIAFSPDGKWLASASGSAATGRELRVVDLNNLQEVFAYRDFTDEILSVSFNAHGNRILCATEDGNAVIWNLPGGGPALTLTNVGSRMAFSPGGEQVAGDAWEEIQSGQKSHHLGIRIWNSTSGEEITTLTGPEPLVEFRDVAYSPNGRFLAAASPDRKVVVWELASGSPLLSLYDAGSRVMFSPDSLQIATADAGAPVKIWEIPSGREIASFRAALRSASFSPDGQRLAAPGPDETVRVWDTSRDPEARTISGLNSSTLTGVAFSPDNQLVALANDGWEERGPGQSVSQTFGTVSLWDVKTGTNRIVLRSSHEPQLIRDIAFAAEGDLLAAVSSWNGSDEDPECELLVWDSKTGREVLSLLRPSSDRLTSVAFSPNSRQVAFGGEVDNLAIYDFKKPESLQTFPTRALALAFSPGGQLLASASGPYSESFGEVRLWSMTAGELRAELRPLRGDSLGYITKVLFSPDGRILAASFGNGAGKPGAVVLWDVESGRELLVAQEHEEEVTSLAFSPDGSRLATGSRDQTVKLWEVTSGQSMLTLRGHSSGVLGVAFSNDGRFLASSSSEEVKLWETIRR